MGTPVSKKNIIRITCIARPRVYCLCRDVWLLILLGYMASYVLRQRSGSGELSERSPHGRVLWEKLNIWQCVGGGEAEKVRLRLNN